MIEDDVNNVLKLYGSGGKSSLVIVDLYDIVVKKLRIKIDEMVFILLDLIVWVSFENDDLEWIEFIKVFKDVVV